MPAHSSCLFLFAEQQTLAAKNGRQDTAAIWSPSRAAAIALKEMAVQEAVRDLDCACADRNHLADELASKARSLGRMEKRWEACDRELSHLRRDQGAKIAQVTELQLTTQNASAKVKPTPIRHPAIS